ncbi:sigma-70 family RNA polymerase sigma factor [uncultured Sunxiuqinia sp.]|uniref:RNA polymerase sigma factor n=1 Tax=uncultured Sunxiuqinia sp. TaxID=1573825 RepID=UPI00261B93F0|nr:sigma-70 family RNA polymerase sigma factor [uncultured Sunxiuqinia sp.]
MDERALIRAIQNGEEQAFKQLVDNYQLLVRNTCLSFVRDRYDAEDLAQEVFMEVFRSASKFRGESKLSTWIYRIAVNKSLNFQRDHKRRNFFQSLGDALFGTEKVLEGAIAAVEEHPEQHMVNQERKERIYRAIEELPERQKIAFSLSKLDDLSYQEIAEIMQLSLSSVESLIHRAKLNLQKKLYACYKKGI